MRVLPCLAVILTISLSQSSLAVNNETKPNDEGPFVGGVFSRPASATPFRRDETALRRIALPNYDQDGNSDELIVALNYNYSELVANVASKTSESFRADFDRATVQAVEKGDPKIQSLLAGALRARHLTADMRLDPDIRALLPSDNPREKLEQYIVLRYPSIAAAQQALKQLRQHPAVAYVGNNGRLEFSWAPNDPYFAIQPSAPNAGRYQWGLHAMNFPSAWNVTTGHGYVGAADSGLLNNEAPLVLLCYK